MQTKPIVWILEDDADCQFVYADMLDFRYRLQFFSTLASFAKSMLDDAAVRPDLIIADLRLTDGNLLNYLSDNSGLSLQRFPVIIVSSNDDVDAIRASFHEGARDYLTKPFRKSELVAKIERLVEGMTPSFPSASVPPAYKNATSAPGDVAFDMLCLSASRAGVDVELTPRELQILAFLQGSPGRTATRSEILAAVWKGVRVGQRTVDVHIVNLRKKIRRLGVDIRATAPSCYQLVMESDESGASPVLA